MPGVVRDGDTNTAGGKVQSRVSNVLVNGRRICVNGTDVSPHTNMKPPHTSAKTAGGLRNVIANNIPINVNGNRDTCDHPRNSSSTDVIAG